MTRPSMSIALCGLALLAAWNVATAQEVPSRHFPQSEISPPPARPGALAPTPRAMPVPGVSAAPLAARAGAGTDIPRAVPENGVLTVPFNKARIVDLPTAASNVMMINEGIADVHIDSARPTQLLILARSMGSTNLMALDRQGQVIFQTEVRVDVDTAALKSALAKVMPNEQIEVAPYQGAIFMTGSVRSPRAASQVVDLATRFLPAGTELVNMLQVKGSQQVILKVRVAEMSRAVVKDLATSSRFTRTINGRAVSLSSTTSMIAGKTAVGAGSVALRLFGFSNASFSALEQEGLVRTLAEPTLVALSGETANFLSGGETPYPSAMDENGNITYAFRTTGIKLNFTPLVMDDGRINLQVASEVSEIDTNNRVQFNANFVVNGTKTKRTETVIDLSSGGSLMISGLLRDETSSNINGVPLLKDVPGLGSLFRSSDYTNTQVELVVLVTAYLASQVNDPAAMSMPTDSYLPPSDIDLYLLGRLHREFNREGPVPFGRMPITLEGPYGYIMEASP
ncbi:MAG: type II and III secretion system protein family protein [Magnetospirillum sp. WYHS-4]